jgi:hypothetical protein
MSSLSNLCKIGEPVVYVDPKQAEMWAQLPKSARHLIETCKKSTGHAPKIYRSEYTANFALHADRIVRGTADRTIQVVAGIEGTLQPALRLALSGGKRMCILSAGVDECVGAQLPVPVTWRLDLLPRANEALARSPSLRLPFDPQKHVPRSFVAEAGKSWRAPKHEDREALLTEPLVYSDPVYLITFAATEAWGFDSAWLLNEVVEPSGDGYFFVPITYPYSSLLARVHSCIVLANAQNDQNALYADTLPRTAYEVQGTSDGWEIAAGDLSAAIEFIERRLLPALVVLDDPGQLTLTVKPFGAQRWSEVWARHQATLAMLKTPGVKMPVSASASKEIRCTLRIVVYFADLAERGLPPSLSPDDDNDDGEARMIQMPRGVLRMAPYTPQRAPAFESDPPLVEHASEYTSIAAVSIAAAASAAAAPSGAETAELTTARSNRDDAVTIVDDDMSQTNGTIE